MHECSRLGQYVVVCDVLPRQCRLMAWHMPPVRPSGSCPPPPPSAPMGWRPALKRNLEPSGGPRVKRARQSDDSGSSCSAGGGHSGAARGSGRISSRSGRGGVLAVTHGVGKGRENANSCRSLGLGWGPVKRDSWARDSDAGGVSFVALREGKQYGKQHGKGGNMQARDDDPELEEQFEQLAYERDNEQRSRSPSRGRDCEAGGCPIWSKGNTMKGGQNKGRGKGGGDKDRGGWAVRTKVLVGYILGSKWAEASQLSAEFWNSWPGKCQRLMMHVINHDREAAMAYANEIDGQLQAPVQHWYGR